MGRNPGTERTGNTGTVMVTNRKPIGKKKRFEIFKRDSFTCQYCGSKPPVVVLEIDHIIPVSKGGENKEDNLITACFSCNRGKSANLITDIKPDVSETLAKVQEREEQLRAYRRYKNKIQKRLNADCNKIEAIFTERFPDQCFTERFRVEVKLRFLAKLEFEECMEAISIACGKMYRSDRAIKYFCGICWRKIKKDGKYDA